MIFLNYIIKLSIIFIYFIITACKNPSEELIYDYSLIDLNINSSTYHEFIGPTAFNNDVTLHYFGHQYWSDCSTLVGKLNDLYNDLLSEEIEGVKIIIIGKEQYSEYNLNWIDNISLPVVVDPIPNNLWENWDANQWDLYFLDSQANFVKKINIYEWDYDVVYSSIKALLE